MPQPLPPASLRKSCDPSRFDFVTTADLGGDDGVPGQDRAEDAIRFAFGIAGEGFNVYAMGPAGLGKHEIVRRLLDERARTQETPPDWCYVHDFQSGQKPAALKLPPGRAGGFARAMERFVQEVRGAIPAAFETDEYRVRRSEIEAEAQERHDRTFDEVRVKARERGLDLVRMPVGMALAPLKDGEVMDPEVFGRFSPEEQKKIRALMN